MSDISPRAFAFLAGGILLAALCLRLAAVGQRELWLDECFSVLVTQAPGGAWVATHAADGIDGNNPPVYYWSLEAWTARFGITEAGVRSLSVVAGILQMLALWAVARALEFPRRTVVLVLAVAAVSGIHVYYSVEGRSYMLLVALLTTALAAYVHGVRSGRIFPWIVHGAAVAVAIYTHAIVLPFVAAFWLALPLLSPRPRTWLRLGAAHLGAGLLYIPWLPVLLGSRGQSGRAWIANFYHDLPRALLAPRSLEVFGVGGQLPDYLTLFPDVHPAARAFSMALFAAAGAAVLWWGLRSPATGKAAAVVFPRRAVPALLVFLVWPLVFLYVYSALIEPLYLVGRYDLSAFPAYLLLAGLGLDRLMALVPAGRRGLALAVVLLALTGLGAHAARNAVFHPALRSRGGPNAERAEILARYLSPGDAVVCTGMTVSPTRYALLRRSLNATLVTFPMSQMKHLGWFHAPDVVKHEEAAARADARTIVDWIAADPPRHRMLWVMVPTRTHDREDFTRILDWLLGEVRARGCRLAIPVGEEARWQELGVYPVVPEGAPALEPR